LAAFCFGIVPSFTTRFIKPCRTVDAVAQGGADILVVLATTPPFAIGPTEVR
jgi:hypothetical protein